MEKIPQGVVFTVSRPWHGETKSVWPIVMYEEGTGEYDWEVIASVATPEEARRIVALLNRK